MKKELCLILCLLVGVLDTYVNQHLCDPSPVTLRIPKWCVPFHSLKINLVKKVSKVSNTLAYCLSSVSAIKEKWSVL
jgi:hypothetical protein